MLTPVLLVDDDPIVLRMHAAVLRSFGMPHILAETIEDALGHVRKHKISLIVSDVQMPGQGGFDFARQLKELELKTMPVLFLTGYDDLETLRGGLRAGGDDFIIKGSKASWLRERLAFWSVSGFRTLPDELRRRALAHVNAMKGDAFTGVEGLLARRSDMVKMLAQQMAKEMAAASALSGTPYGERLVERVCFLARLSNLVIRYSEDSGTAGDFLRFPDYVYRVTQKLNLPWGPEFSVLLKEFDYWSQDPRFVLAGEEALLPYAHYSWAASLHLEAARA